MKTAKIFKSGNSQAVRLPKDYRVDSDSVRINKIGNMLVLLPPDDPWAGFLEGVQQAVDFPQIDDAPPTDIDLS